MSSIERKKVEESNKIVELVGAEIVRQIERLIDKKFEQIEVIEKADAFSFTETKRATTTSSKYPDKDKPNLEFKNPLDKILKIREFSIIPNSAFKTKGMVEIRINQSLIYRSSTVANLTDLVDHISRLVKGKRIKSTESVKVFIKNDDNSTSIGLTVTIQFAE